MAKKSGDELEKILGEEGAEPKTAAQRIKAAKEAQEKAEEAAKGAAKEVSKEPEEKAKELKVKEEEEEMKEIVTKDKEIEEEEEVLKRSKGIETLENLMESLEDEEDEKEVEEEEDEELEELTGIDDRKEKAIDKFRRFSGRKIFGAIEIQSTIEIGLGAVVKYIEENFGGAVVIEASDKPVYKKIESLPANFSDKIKEELYYDITADETVPCVLKLCIDYNRYTTEQVNTLDSLNNRRKARVTDIKRIQKEFGAIMPNIDNGTGTLTPVSIARYNKEDSEIQIYLSWKAILDKVVDETGKTIGNEPNEYSIKAYTTVNKEDLTRSTVQLIFVHNKYVEEK